MTPCTEPLLDLDNDIAPRGMAASITPVLDRATRTVVEEWLREEA